MTFRDLLEEDMNFMFACEDEFAETHNINGEDVPIILDSDILNELNLGKTVDTDEIFTDKLLFFIQKKHLPNEPCPGQVIQYDSDLYLIDSVNEDMGGYAIVLGVNQD